MKFKTLTSLGDRSFAASPPQLWNSLPHAIRSGPSGASFKKTLKNFSFKKVFCNFMCFLISFSVGFMHNYLETTVKGSKAFMLMMIIIIVINALFKLEKSFSIKKNTCLNQSSLAK